MQLSQRLSSVASMVTAGNCLADVGTDHGYVPIYLYERNIIPRAIAMDVNKGPLERARLHIAEFGFENAIETRLSDGMAALKPGEVDSVTIAGMGGPLIIRILSAYPEVTASLKELILQPQSEISEVRSWLYENGYEIIEEHMVYEDGKYYPMMKVVPVEEELAEWNGMNPEVIKTCDIYGPLLIKNGNPVLRRFLVKQHKQLRDILKKLKEQPENEKISKRIK